jgi:hypothetical protein
MDHEPNSLAWWTLLFLLFPGLLPAPQHLPHVLLVVKSIWLVGLCLLRRQKVSDVQLKCRSRRQQFFPRSTL